MKKAANIIIRFRKAIIIACLLITGLLGFFIKDLRINAEITSYLPPHDSVVTRFNYIGDTYSSSSMAIVILEDDSSVFTRKNIGIIRDITDTLKQLEGVNFVTSLTSVLDIRKTEDGLEIGRLVDEYDLPESTEELSALKDYTLGKSLYRGRLVSEDARYAVIICRMDESMDKITTAESIRAAVLATATGSRFYFDGMPFQVSGIFDFILKDLLLLTPLIVLVVGLCLFISFRSFRRLILPLISVAMGTVWSMGLMSLAGVMLTPVSDAIPVVLFAVGSAYGIHIINRFSLLHARGGNSRENAITALSQTGPAVILAGITTVAGFLSFVIGAYLNIISDFGIYSAAGILFILLLSVTFTPALLSFFPAGKIRMLHENGFAGKDLLSRLMTGLAGIVVKRNGLILLSTVVISVVFAAGIPFIRNNIDILNYFSNKTSIRKSANVMNAEFGGSLPVQVRVRGDIYDPAVLNGMKEVQRFLDRQPEVSNAQSVVDFIEEMNDCMGEGKRIPDSRDKVANLWFLIEGEEVLEQMVSSDKTEALILAYITNTETARYHAIHDSLNLVLDKLNQGDAEYVQTGMPAIYSSLDDSLMNNLMQSMLLAFVIIFICLLFLLRSVKSSLIGLIPLVFTMIIIFGFMGIAGIALDIATVLIAGITVGAGIDYAIHFITEYRRQTLEGENEEEAIKNTITHSGRAIAINVFTIMTGFLILVFANLIPLRNFGILIAITMLFSGLGAVTVLPAFITFFKINPVRKKSKRNLQ